MQVGHGLVVEEWAFCPRLEQGELQVADRVEFVPRLKVDSQVDLIEQALAQAVDLRWAGGRDQSEPTCVGGFGSQEALHLSLGPGT